MYIRDVKEAGGSKRYDQGESKAEAAKRIQAAGRLNGLIIKPGETFNYWKLIGKPTAEKGYLPGMVLS